MDDQFIGLEGAYNKLLCHFSGLAKKQLSAHGANRLYIPHCDKKVVVWIYRYMLAGEKDPEGDKKFDDLDLSHLVHLYNHACTLEYEGLMNKIMLRARYLVREGPVLDAQTIRQVASVDHLRPVLANAIAQKAVEVGEINWTDYFAGIEDNEDLNGLVGSAIEKELKRLVSKSEWFYNRYKSLADVQFSTRYYRQPSGPVQAVERGRLRVRAANDHVTTSIHADGLAQAESKKQKKPRLPKRKAMTEPPANRTPMDEGAAEEGLAEEGLAEEGAAPKPRVKLPVAVDSKKSPKTDAEGTQPDAPRKRKARKSRGKAKQSMPTTTALEPEPDSAAPASSEPNHHPSHTHPHPDPSKPTLTCYNCSLPGYLARSCQSAFTREPPVCYNCNGTGHIARNCSVPKTPKLNQQPSSTRPPPLCYNCNETGHIARNCSVSAVYDGHNGYSNSYSNTKTNTNIQGLHFPGAPGTLNRSVSGTNTNTFTPIPHLSSYLDDQASGQIDASPSYAGRNKNYRRAKLERGFVEPMGIGEGVEV
jgi:hypothetical protein